MVQLARSENEKRILAAYQRAKEVMADRFGISSKDMPTLVIKRNNDRALYDRKQNLIYIDVNKEDIGNAVSEELGHYMRDRFTSDLGDTQHPAGKKSNEERLTHEFFGFLGRRIFYQGLTEHERQVLFPAGEPALPKKYRHVMLDNSRNDRRYLRQARNEFEALREKAYEFWKGNMHETERLEKQADAQHAPFFRNLWTRAMRDRDNDLKESVQEVRKYVRGRYDPKVVDTISNAREDLLTHTRAYRFASELDLSRVDVEKLYALPERDVRMHFFRSDPNYEITSPASKKKQRKLEELVATSLLILISIPAFFFPEFTGYAIANITAPNPLFLILVLALLFTAIIVTNKAQL